MNTVQKVIIFLLALLTVLNFVCGEIAKHASTYSTFNKITFIISLFLCICMLFGIPSQIIFDKEYGSISASFFYSYFGIGTLILILSVLTLIKKVGNNKKVRIAISGVYLCCMAGLLYIFSTSWIPEVDSFYSYDVSRNAIQDMVTRRENELNYSPSSPTHPEDYVLP